MLIPTSSPPFRATPLFRYRGGLLAPPGQRTLALSALPLSIAASLVLRHRRAEATATLHFYEANNRNI